MADAKISELTAIDAVTGVDLLAVVDDPAGTPATKKATATQLKDFVVGAGSVSVASGKTLTASNTLTFTGTDSSSVAFGAGGTVAYTNATANGKSLARFTPLDNQPPASNFATLDTRNSVATLDFDDGTDESAVFVGVIPQGAILTSGIKVRIFWAATTATSGSCDWNAAFEKYGTDIDSDSFDTATELHTTTSGTSGIVNLTEITCTAIDSLVAGDQFRIRITRDANDATNDTMTGDAELIAVELQQVA